MKLVEVTDRKGLDDLYNSSALTFLGITRESIPEMLEWVKQYTPFKTEIETVYAVSGRVMNDEYRLTGLNRYVDHLSIVCVKLSDLVNPMRLAIPRFQVGGKWFDDVVDNNARREEEKLED